MKLALVAKRTSSNSDPDAVERMLRSHGASVDCYDGDQADEAAAAGADRLVVASGDGNVAAAAAAAARAGIPLAVVPSGTANDFARTAGIPLDHAAACRIAATSTTSQAHDLAWCDEAPFVNVTSLGLSVDALRRSERFKPLVGPLGYPAGAARTMLTASPIECRVEVDGATVHDGPAWQVLVGASGMFGGGASVDTEPGTGALQVVVLEHGPRVRLLRHAWALQRGHVTRHGGTTSRDGGTVIVEFAGVARHEVDRDGDPLEVGSRVEFRIEPGAFDLVVPHAGGS